MKSVPIQPMVFLRCVLRFSTLLRALWLLVAALHLWLIMRRMITGEWTSPLDFLRAALCLGGVGYASLKFWQIATIFDSAPRRALAFALILLIGHWLIAPDQQGETQNSYSMMFIAVLTTLPALAALLPLARRAKQIFRRKTLSGRLPASQILAFARPNLPLSILRRASFHFHRPPPLFC